MNLANVPLLTTTPATGTWYRALALRWLPTALSTTHTRITRSRFNAAHLLSPTQQFPIYYLCDHPIVAQFECGALFGSPFGPGSSVPNPSLAIAVLNVVVTLTRVVDLTDWSPGGSQDLLGTNAQELTGDWDGWFMRGMVAGSVSGPTGATPTQELGHALNAQGFEGFFAVSAKVPTQRNLVVLPDNFDPGSSVEYYDSSGTLVHSIP